MTQRELYNAIKGYNDKEVVMLRASWEQSRWLGAVLLNSNPYDKKKYQPRDLMTFPWENEVTDRGEEIELIKERRKWLTR